MQYRRRSVMTLQKNQHNAFAKTGTFHRPARMFMVVLAACAVIVVAPRLRSAMDDAAPTFTQTNLVSDVPGMAKTTDPSLVNPWGMALGLNSGIWISDNGTGKATTYDGKGQPILPQVVTIPSPKNSAGGVAPTGVATNDTAGFVVSAGGKSAPASELFATEDGTIAGWSMSVDPAKAVIAVDNSATG